LSLSVVQYQIGDDESVLDCTAIRVAADSIADAEDVAARIAAKYMAHGFDDEDGYWWFRTEDGRKFRLIIETAE